MRDTAIGLLKALPDDVTLPQIIAALGALKAEGTEEAPPSLYDGWRKGVSYGVSIVAGVAACITIALIASRFWTEAKEDKFSFFIVYALWTMAPPLWFFIEYEWLFDRLRRDPLRVQDFNTSQALAQKFWAALLVFLGVFALVLWDTKF